MFVLEAVEGPCTGQRFIQDELTGLFHRLLSEETGRVLKRGYPRSRFPSEFFVGYTTRTLVDD